MKIQLEIDDAPPTANQMWRMAHGRQVLSRDAKQWYETVRYFLAGVKVPKEWPFYKVEIVVEPKIRRGDVDNRIKPVLDALTKCQFWTDDEKVAFVSCRFGKVNRAGKTFVTVSRMERKFLSDGE